jgi:hypothetical protein
MEYDAWRGFAIDAGALQRERSAMTTSEVIARPTCGKHAVDATTARQAAQSRR